MESTADKLRKAIVRTLRKDKSDKTKQLSSLAIEIIIAYLSEDRKEIEQFKRNVISQLIIDTSIRIKEIQPIPCKEIAPMQTTNLANLATSCSK